MSPTPARHAVFPVLTPGRQMTKLGDHWNGKDQLSPQKVTADELMAWLATLGQLYRAVSKFLCPHFFFSLFSSF